MEASVREMVRGRETERFGKLPGPPSRGAASKQGRHNLGRRTRRQAHAHLSAISLLACARIGAVHSVVFGGFSADSIRDRINDSGAIALVTADGSYRRGGILPRKKNVGEALR